MDTALKNIANMTFPIASMTVPRSGFGEHSSSNDEHSSSNGENNGSSTSSLFGTLMFFFALYLAFKCKTTTGGVDILQLLLACCCSPCYVVYRLAKPCGGKIF